MQTKDTQIMSFLFHFFLWEFKRPESIFFTLKLKKKCFKHYSRHNADNFLRPHSQLHQLLRALLSP